MSATREQVKGIETAVHQGLKVKAVQRVTEWPADDRDELWKLIRILSTCEVDWKRTDVPVAILALFTNWVNDPQLIYIKQAIAILCDADRRQGAESL